MLEISIRFNIQERRNDWLLIEKDFSFNHNDNKIVKSDCLSTALISALIGQFNRTVRAITRALKWLFFSLLAKQDFEFLVFWFKK